MKKIWVHKAYSFQEAESFEVQYYQKMKPEERLSIVQFLRNELLRHLGKRKINEYRKRLRRFYRVIKQA